MASYEVHLSAHTARRNGEIEVLIEFFENAEPISAASVSAADIDGEFDTVTWDEDLGDYDTPPDEVLCDLANAFLRSRG